MEEKIAMLMSLILVVLISNFTLNMVAAESYCHGQCRVLVNACKRLILRQSPTAECCLRIRRTPMWCICSIITPQLAALVNANDVSDAVGVICQCGRPVACSTKCGSKCVYHQSQLVIWTLNHYKYTANAPISNWCTSRTNRLIMLETATIHICKFPQPRCFNRSDP